MFEQYEGCPQLGDGPRAESGASCRLNGLVAIRRSAGELEKVFKFTLFDGFARESEHLKMQLPNDLRRNGVLQRTAARCNS